MPLNNLISPQDKQTITRWQRNLSVETDIRLTKTGTSQDGPFLDFCNQLSRLLPNLTVKQETEEDLPRPALHIGVQVSYQAIPLGPELPPFLEALTSDNKIAASVPHLAAEMIREVKIPALLKLYVTPHCPHCPEVARKLIGLCSLNGSLRLTIIDGVLFPGAASEDNIQSAPTVVLDQFRWGGSIRLEELAAVIANRDPVNLSADTLSSMLHDGAATRVANMMIDSQKIFPSFIELLVNEKWTHRLGAMVVMEDIADRDNPLAATAVKPLQSAFNTLPDPVKGDMLYILGEIGDPTPLPFIRQVARDTGNKEVKMAAQEAMEAIINVGQK